MTPRISGAISCFSAFAKRATFAALAALSLVTMCSAGQLPDLNLRTLSGAELSWPDDLPPGGAILVMVQDQGQQEQASSWLPFLGKSTVPGEAAMAYYIAPILPEGLLIVRGIVEQTISMATDDPLMLERTVPIFIDIAALQADLGLDPSSDVQVALLSDQGVLLEAVSGAYSDALGQTLRAAIEAARSTDEPFESVGIEHVVQHSE